MARTIFYRQKTPQGDWTRVTGTPPFTISGLTAETVYEIDTGDGVIIERTPLVNSITLSELTLSSTSVSESASVGATVGNLENVTEGSTLSLTDDAEGLFEISGESIVTAAALDYETAQSHDITVRETLSGASNTPNDTTFTITVTDVVEGSDTIAPVISDLVIADDVASFFADESGTGHWLLDSTISYTDADELIAAKASGEASGSFAVGANEITETSLDWSEVANGSYYLHFGVLDEAGNASNVLTEEITLDVAPAVMASDPAALMWHAPDSVTASGGVATVITDKTGNGHTFNVVPTGMTGPSFDGTKLSFNGVNNAIRSTTNGPLIPKIFTDTDEVALFFVVAPYQPASVGESIGFSNMFYEHADSGSNSTFGVRVNQSNTVAQYEGGARRFSSSFAASVDVPGLFSPIDLIVLVVNQTQAWLRLNGVATTPVAVNLSNFPNSAQKMSLGGRVTDAGLGTPNFKGDLYEIFATHDASLANIEAIEAELAGKYPAVSTKYFGE